MKNHTYPKNNGVCNMQSAVGFLGTDIYKEKPLRRDVRFLGDLLGEVLIEQEGKRIFDIVEKIRHLKKEIRDNYVREFNEELVSTVNSLTHQELYKVTQAFTIYFKLVNIAELIHRIRRRREYKFISDVKDTKEDSLERLLYQLRDIGISFDRLLKLLHSMSIELLTMAHPTEVDRHNVLEKFCHISILLKELENPVLTTGERKMIKSDRRAPEIMERLYSNPIKFIVFVREINYDAGDKTVTRR